MEMNKLYCVAISIFTLSVFSLTMFSIQAEAKTWVKDICPTLNQCTEMAEQGDIRAQYTLGYMYYNRGLYKEENLPKAIRWWKLAAESEHGCALNYLAWVYSIGEGVKKNAEVSQEYRIRAARAGSARAQFEVAQKLRWSKNVEDLITAYAWYYISVNKVSNGAYGYRDEVFSKLNKTSQQQAQELANRYSELYFLPYKDDVTLNCQTMMGN